ncbi:helix-turn-helix domain-containing protein [Paenarthrobacter sp. DKR-5]|uniref:helix-turn-helix transcriptional regulator n=1 Tax=Paenarthrobacter sp. DKR-5 TaxID=2835535 RepID=UPI001BDC0D1B|nr:helix-turn-helix domain-containing protein [Paenarthrobacter sp. DKR-5]MBT1002633.1 helix-turn-helix domain-containing protein [Paenarthrobacter sp. DKR-5]
MSAIDTPERHLTPQDLADRLGVPLQTVRLWRHKGVDPQAMKLGRHVRYRLSDVLAWEQAKVEAGSK